MQRKLPTGVQVLHIIITPSTFEVFQAENVFAMKSWCKSKFFLEEEMIDKQFGIPADFDYI